MTTDIAVVVTRFDAERWADRIRLDLEGAADRIEAGKLKIRTAIVERHDLALGYASPGAYLSDRFADALSRLGVDSRREFVGELTEAGLSTRAIAPVVGVSQKTVVKDQQSISSDTEVSLAPEPPVNTDTGEVSDDYQPKPEPRKITGLNGKTYTRPEPKAEPTAPSKPKRRAITDQARTAGWELSKAVERLERIAADDRFAANRDQVAPHLRSHLSNAVEVCQDLLDRINNNQ